MCIFTLDPCSTQPGGSPSLWVPLNAAVAHTAPGQQPVGMSKATSNPHTVKGSGSGREGAETGLL